MSVCALRTAKQEDLSSLVDLAEEANKESDYRLPFHRDSAAKYLWGYIKSPECDIILGSLDDKFAGGVMLAYSNEFHKEPFCYVGKFWVLPNARRSHLARFLLSATLEWAKEKKCSHVFATATAGLDEKEQRLFINLMKRSGFVDKGPVLCLTF